MRWLITGWGGLLAPYLRDAAAAEGEAVVSGRHSGDLPCDLTDPAAVATLIREVRPNRVVNAAGLTDVDGCERDPAAAQSANHDTVIALAAALPEGAALVHVSTDQVYPDTTGPHAEDGVGPVNAYGRTKLAGETAALSHPGALVVRTNFFGPARETTRRSLSDFFAESLAARRPVTLFEDVLFSPLHMETLSHILIEASVCGLRGTYNLGSRDGMSKAAFALAAARHLGLPTDSATVGRSTDMPARAARPRDLRLDVAKLEAALGRALPTLEDEIGKL